MDCCDARVVMADALNVRMEAWTTNLNDASDDDGSLLEEIGDSAADWHDAFTANFDRQLGQTPNHAQLHLSTRSDAQFDTLRFNGQIAYLSN